jgi:hypothetical protein
VGTGRSYRSFLSHGIPSSELEGCVRKLEVVFHYPGANVFFLKIRQELCHSLRKEESVQTIQGTKNQDNEN